MLYNYFDAAYCINLESRPDRLFNFMERARSVGLEVIRFPAIMPSLEECMGPWFYDIDVHRNKKLGNTLSHQAVIRDAKAKGYKRVLVFEDDAFFLSEFNQFQDYVEELRMVPYWDIFYLGGSPDNGFHSRKFIPCEQVTNTHLLYHVDVVWGTHAYAIQESFYDTVLNINPMALYPMDISLIHTQKRTYLLGKKLLVTQDDSISDLTGLRISQTAIYQENYEKSIQ